MEHKHPGDPDFVPYANGATYVPYCIGRGCDADAIEMVGPSSLCAPCAVEERRQIAATRRRAAAYAASPEGRAEMAREQRLEARYS